MELVKRFLDKCVRADNGCLLYKGQIDSRGYGQIVEDGNPILVHRLVMHLVHGFDLDSSKHILHNDDLCSSKTCVEISHLREGTAQENFLDRVKKYGKPFGTGPHFNSIKTHCKKCKLPLDGENLYQYGGKRYCRNCRKKTNKRLNSQKQKESEG